MKVKAVIELLNHWYKPDDDILMIYWDKFGFSDYKFTKEQWEEVVNKLDGYSFDGGSEDVNTAVAEIFEEMENECQ